MELPGSNVILLGKGSHPRMNCHDHIGGGVLESRYINTSVIQCIMPLSHSNNVQLLFLRIDLSLTWLFTQADIRVRSIPSCSMFEIMSGGTPLNLPKYCKLFGAALVPSIVTTDRSMCTTLPMCVGGSFCVGIEAYERDFINSNDVSDYISDPIFVNVPESVSITQ